MGENFSQMVGNDIFKCQIELFEENTEYEILVVPETESRKLNLIFSCNHFMVIYGCLNSMTTKDVTT